MRSEKFSLQYMPFFGLTYAIIRYHLHAIVCHKWLTIKINTSDFTKFQDKNDRCANTCILKYNNINTFPGKRRPLSPILPRISAEGKQTTVFKAIDRHGNSFKDSVFGEDTVSNSSSEVECSDFDSDYVPDSHSEETDGSENDCVSLTATVKDTDSAFSQNFNNKKSGSVSQIDSLTGQQGENYVDSYSTSSHLDSCTTYTVMPTSNTAFRVYDKKFYCLYCNVPQSKLPRHLINKHADEKEVQLYVQKKKTLKK